MLYQKQNFPSKVVPFLLLLSIIQLLSCYASTDQQQVAPNIVKDHEFSTATATATPILSSSSQDHHRSVLGDDDEKNRHKKRLNLETMSQHVRQMEYAVRGKVVIAADKIADELNDGTHSGSYPFDHIVYTNIGNPQSVGQKPLTWPRQVLALVDLPDDHGINHPDVAKLFPIDAIERAREMKMGLQHSSGAYTHSKGARCFRDDVAAFIQQRDGGLSCNPEHIFLTNGASAAILMVLQSIIRGPQTGIMIPIPQYPIYSASIDMIGATKVGYYMDEENGWELNIQELERSLQEANDAGIEVMALVLINPGNPTGQVLSKENLSNIITFCVQHKIVLLADEVYQDNVYDDNLQFYSAKRIAYECGYIRDDLSSDIELISFHSVSKGLFGECGRRGGYMEFVGIDEDVIDEIYKLASSSLCSTVNGQVMTSLMVRGPNPTDVSYQSHESEKKAVYESLKRRSKVVSDGLNSIEGFHCIPASGAMYCFPSIQIPAGAIEEANRQGISPDTLYAISLLESTGICVVPASGFGQKHGRYGFRTTFLPPEQEMDRCVQLFRKHYKDFTRRYSNE